MGIVYLAVHPLLGRKAVIKLLLPQYSNSAQVVTRFFHEAKASALIGHPGIIDIFDFGHSEQGDAYLVMEFLDGESLAARMKREGTMAPSLVVAVARQVTSALSAAHAKSIVHRDLKPDNLFLLPDRDSALGFRVKVLDFGIAKLAREAMAEAVATNAGVTIGTPKYMSPEQCLDAAAVDGRADIYSLGCILFEMLCGRPPFRADTYAEMLAQHIATPPPAPSALVNGVPAELEAIVMRALEKDLGRRYRTMDDMAADLDRLAQPGTLPTERPAAIAHREPTEALPQVTPNPEGVSLPAKSQPIGTASTVLAAPAVTPPAPTSIPPVAPTPLPPQIPAMRVAPESMLESSGDRVIETTTNLGAAASEIRRYRPTVRRAILPAAAVGVVLGLAGVAIAIAVVQEDRPPESPQAAELEGAPDPDQDPSADPSADPSPLPAREPSTEAAVPAKLVTLRVESDPSGADVFRASDGVRLGRTPVVQHVPQADDDASFILRRAGFREARVSIPVSRDGIGYVQLEKDKAPPKKKAKEPDRPPAPKTTTRSTKVKKPAPINDGALDPFSD